MTTPSMIDLLPWKEIHAYVKKGGSIRGAYDIIVKPMGLVRLKTFRGYCVHKEVFSCTSGRKDKKSLPARHGKKFTPDEDKQLLTLRKKGVAYDDIAPIMERSPDSLMARKYVLDGKRPEQMTGKVESRLDKIDWMAAIGWFNADPRRTRVATRDRFGPTISVSSFARRMQQEMDNAKDRPVRMLDKYMPVSRHAGLDSGVVFV